MPRLGPNGPHGSMVRCNAGLGGRNNSSGSGWQVVVVVVVLLPPQSGVVCCCECCFDLGRCFSEDVCRSSCAPLAILRSFVRSLQQPPYTHTTTPHLTHKYEALVYNTRICGTGPRSMPSGPGHRPIGIQPRCQGQLGRLQDSRRLRRRLRRLVAILVAREGVLGVGLQHLGNPWPSCGKRRVPVDVGCLAYPRRQVHARKTNVAAVLANNLQVDGVVDPGRLGGALQRRPHRRRVGLVHQRGEEPPCGHLRQGRPVVLGRAGRYRRLVEHPSERRGLGSNQGLGRALRQRLLLLAGTDPGQLDVLLLRRHHAGLADHPDRQGLRRHRLLGR